MRIIQPNHYIIRLKLHFNKVFIIWISDEIDAVLLDDQQRIMGFETETALRNYAESSNIALDAIEGITSYDFSALQRLLLEPDKYFDAGDYLNIWHLFIDISTSLNLEFLGDKKGPIRDSLYDKLFDIGGPFLASGDPNPTFDQEEVAKLSEIMQDGLKILFDNLSVNK